MGKLEPFLNSNAENLTAGPAWDIVTEYPGLGSNEFLHDLSIADALKDRIVGLVRELQPLLRGAKESQFEKIAGQLQTLSELSEQTRTIYHNLGTYANCLCDVDGTDDDAFKTKGLIQGRQSELRAEMKSVDLFLTLAPEKLVKLYLQNPHTAAEAYHLHRERALAATRLSEAEEILLERLRPNGPEAFGSLYSQISSSIRCQVASPSRDKLEFEEMGLAQAVGMLRDTSETARRAAWHGIQSAWQKHEDAGAAILNGLAGWRTEEYRQRSRQRPVDFLTMPIHHSGIQRQTLDAMMSAVTDAIPTGRRAMLAMAKAIGKPALDPWDLLAAAPQRADDAGNRWTFKEGLHLIRDAFAAVHPEFADFVDTMEKNRWIEARVLASKRQGAYCTSFAKSRTPRVFQTFMGSLGDVRTLAHELGHAYHAWVMRDMPSTATHYPMTLAETASLFAETALSEHLTNLGPRYAFEVGWSEAQATAAHLLNIPARFSFEKAFYKARETSRFTTAKELGDLTTQAWNEWYGDSLSEPERLFWISKLHFSISRVSFYNFPYTFGALFAQGIYARRKDWGADFLPTYVALLRDTGSLSAEDLARKHLGEDIADPKFWEKSIAFMEKQTAKFEDIEKPSRNILV